jgi:hypothetical protein
MVGPPKAHLATELTGPKPQQLDELGGALEGIGDHPALVQADRGEQPALALRNQGDLLGQRPRRVALGEQSQRSPVGLDTQPERHRAHFDPPFDAASTRASATLSPSEPDLACSGCHCSPSTSRSPGSSTDS